MILWRMFEQNKIKNPYLAKIILYSKGCKMKFTCEFEYP